MIRSLLMLGLLLCVADSPAALAQQPGSRFPQPVRAGDLPGRDLIAPEEAQPRLGRIVGVVQGPAVVVRTSAIPGGVVLVGGSEVVVPVADVSVSGYLVVLTGLKPEELARQPRYDAAATPALPPDTTIQVGLIGPSH